jgi:hypothetical protein
VKVKVKVKIGDSSSQLIPCASLFGTWHLERGASTSNKLDLVALL